MRQAPLRRPPVIGGIVRVLKSGGRRVDALGSARGRSSSTDYLAFKAAAITVIKTGIIPEGKSTVQPDGFVLNSM